jgi:hypothetical protein
MVYGTAQYQEGQEEGGMMAGRTYRVSLGLFFLVHEESFP